jgi:hypothetical protein
MEACRNILKKRRTYSCACNSDIPVRGVSSFVDSSARKVIDLLTISLFRENNFTSNNQIYFEKFWSASLHATEYPLQHNLQGYGVYRLQFCIPALSCDKAYRKRPERTSVHNHFVSVCNVWFTCAGISHSSLGVLNYS